MQPWKAKVTFKEGFLIGNPAAAPFKDLVVSAINRVV
jgi:hypothetical protein